MDDLFGEVQSTSATLKRYAPSQIPDSKHIARTPAFLKFESRPFDGQQFLKSTKSVDELAIESNAVRWMYTPNKEQNQVSKSSNARIVYWEDGSQTLQIGNEHFAVKTNNMQEPVLITTSDEPQPNKEETEKQMLNTAHVVNSNLSFLPTSTSSKAHQMLASALQQKQQQNEIRVQSVSTKEDPDKVQRELEKMESLKEKARKRLATEEDVYYEGDDDNDLDLKIQNAKRNADSDMDLDSDNGSLDEESGSKQDESDKEIERNDKKFIDDDSD